MHCLSQKACLSSLWDPWSWSFFLFLPRCPFTVELARLRYMAFAHRCLFDLRDPSSRSYYVQGHAFLECSFVLKITHGFQYQIRANSSREMSTLYTKMCRIVPKTKGSECLVVSPHVETRPFFSPTDRGPRSFIPRRQSLTLARRSDSGGRHPLLYPSCTVVPRRPLRHL